MNTNLPRSETNVSSSPFSLYDIFGYIVPGLVFVVFALLLIFHFVDYFPLKSQFIIENHDFQFKDLEALRDYSPWWIETTFLISTITIVYIFGHLIASSSSLLIDKFLIKKIAGYPSFRLFNLKFNTKFSIGFYKFIFFAINTYLIRLMFFPIPAKTEFIIAGALIVLFLITKMVLSNEKIQSNKTLKPKFKKIGIALSRPFNFIAHFLVNAFSLHEPFNHAFIKSFRKNFEKVYKMSINDSNTNLYWLSYCYVVERNEHMKDTIKQFLRLYGFTRNLSTSFFLLFIIVLIIKLNGAPNTYRLHTLGFLFYCSSTLFLIRYYYLYYNYYSKFIFRSFLYLSTKD